jgi:uncharacterized membrane protein
MKKSYWITIAILGTALILFLLVGTILLGNWNNVGWGMMGGWPAGTMHGWGFGSVGWFGMLIMWLIPVGIVVLASFGIVWLVRGFTSINKGNPIINRQGDDQKSPREILQMRYASGDITRDQYLQILDDIE